MISIIASTSENLASGKDNKLLFAISEDLKRFKRITMGHPIIMGRKTYESIGRVLPNRTNIIITRDKNYKKEACIVVGSLPEAIHEASKAPGNEEIFIIGGGQIWAQALPYTDRIYLTVFHKVVKDADTFFPDYSAFKRVIAKEEKTEGDLSYTYLELER